VRWIHHSVTPNVPGGYRCPTLPLATQLDNYVRGTLSRTEPLGRQPWRPLELIATLRPIALSNLAWYPEFWVSSGGWPSIQRHPATSCSSMSDRLRGTLELLVLRTLAWGPRHGYAIARWLQDTTSAALRVEDGSLYPALYRMEQRGWIESDWRRSELDRPAKFYRLTAAGRRQLKKETSEWRAFVDAVAIVLEPSQ